MVRNTLTILLLTWSLAACLHTRAQPSYRFEHFSVRHGLRGSEVASVLQDQDGFIWLGTSGGLSRYDGYNITTYTPDPDDPYSLNHNWVLDLHQTRAGALWVGTGRGLCRLDKANQTFACYEHDPNDPQSIGPGWVTTIYEDRDSTLWIGTRDGGLNRFDPATETFTRYTHDPGTQGGLSHNWVTFIDGDPTGMLWIGTHGGGLNRFDPETETFTHYTHVPNVPASLSNDEVRTVLVDQAGKVWVGTSRGLNRFDPATETFTRYLDNPGDPTSLSDDVVHYLYEDRAGTLWIGTRDGGLNRFDPATEAFTHYKHDPRDPTSLSSNTIFSIYEDRQGVLWIGTADGGVNRLDPTTSAFTHVVREPGDPNSLSNNHVRALFAGREGMLWIGTRGGGLNRFDPATGQYTHYTPDPRGSNSLSDNEVEALYQDRKGTLWIGTQDGGLDRFDPATETFTHYRHEEGNPASLASNEVRALYRDREGELWVGTADGLSRYEPSTKTFTNYTRDGDDLGGLISEAVYTITEDQEENLWIGTEGGLCRFDDATDAFTCYKYDPKNAGSLSYGWVTSLYEDQQGILWIGTYGGGLNRFDPRSERFTHFTERNSALPDNVVYCILGDPAGRLWMSTNRGLSRFDPVQESFKTYDTSDGLQSEEFSRGACHQGPEGRLYFGGINGFNAFYPGEISDNPHPPNVALTDFKLFNQSVEPGSDAPLQKPIDETTDITLSHWQDDVSFDYVGLHFSNPAKNRYAYMLEPYDETWREVGPQRRATYTNLDPGEYVFRVKAANSDGVWNEEGTLMRVRILPPWWRTWWAYIVYGLLLIGGVFVVDRIQRRRLIERERNRAEVREAEIRAETAELQAEIAEEHAQKLEALDEAKSRFVANVSHEFRTPLTLLLGPIQDALSGRVDELSRFQLAAMQRNAERLLGLINQLLDLARVETGSMQLHREPVDLVALLRNVTIAFAARAERERITLSFRAEMERLPAFIDPDKVEKVVFNLLSNAFKFTPSGQKVRIQLRSREGPSVTQAEMIVKDTGQGIPPEKLDHIFDRFFQGDDASSGGYAGTGIGLALAKEFVELHDGQIEAESEQGFGTTFTVRVPLEQDRIASENVPLAPDEEQVEGASGAEGGTEAGRTLTDDPEPIGDTDAEPTGACVLIVEDNPDVRSYVRGLLTPRYRVVEARDGDEGFVAAQAHRPDLVIADVMMPRRSGFDLCQDLKSDEELNHIPVVLLTAKADQESRREGFETGADAYLSKPFDAEELLLRVENLIELRRQLRTRYSDIVVVRPTEVEVSSREAAFLERVREVVEEHLDDPGFGVERLAGEVNLSPRQLQRRLRDTTDLSAAAFMRKMRLERAAQLLEQDAGMVSQIAYQIGYQNADAFSRVFREVYGVPPSEYPH